MVLSPATESLASQLGEVRVARQPQPLGTGDAVRCALPSLPVDADEVVISCGDTPLLSGELLMALVEQRREFGAPLAVAAFRAPDPTGYGRLILNDAECATAIVEDRDADEETREIDSFAAELIDRKVKMIVNAGACNPRGCGAAVERAAARLGHRELLPAADPDGMVRDELEHLPPLREHT